MADLSFPDEDLPPQELNLLNYHRNNLKKGTYLDNNGDITTVYIVGVEGPDGKEYNIPGYVNGKIMKAKEARGYAEKAGWQNWPSYNSPQEADAAAESLHKIIDSDTELFNNWKAEQPMAKKDKRSTETKAQDDLGSKILEQMELGGIPEGAGKTRRALGMAGAPVAAPGEMEGYVEPSVPGRGISQHATNSAERGLAQNTMQSPQQNPASTIMDQVYAQNPDFDKWPVEEKMQAMGMNANPTLAAALDKLPPEDQSTILAGFVESHGGGADMEQTALDQGARQSMQQGAAPVDPRLAILAQMGVK